MQARALHLSAGSDVRRSLEQLAQDEGASGFVLSVVGNLSQACFACPGQPSPTVLRGELEIITLQGTISPQGVHLHLSLSDGECQVWGGHLEHGSLVLRGADLLVGWLAAADAQPTPMATARSIASTSDTTSAASSGSVAPTRLTITMRDDCPWSRRALRLLRTLAIPFERREAALGSPVPQIQIDGSPIGGYDALIAWHARGDLEPLRHG